MLIHQSSPHKHYYSLLICTAFLCGSFTSMQGMETIHHSVEFLSHLPKTLSEILSRHTTYAFLGIKYANKKTEDRLNQTNCILAQQTNQLNAITEQRLNQAGQILNQQVNLLNGSIQDSVAQFNTGNMQLLSEFNRSNESSIAQLNAVGTQLIAGFDQSLELRTTQAALCSVAAIAAGVGVYHTINNIDYDKKPEQSGRKFWLGTALAVFNTGYLYKKYCDIKTKQAQRAVNHPNLQSVFTQASSEQMRMPINQATPQSTATYTSTSRSTAVFSSATDNTTVQRPTTTTASTAPLFLRPTATQTTTTSTVSTRIESSSSCSSVGSSSDNESHQMDNLSSIATSRISRTSFPILGTTIPLFMQGTTTAMTSTTPTVAIPTPRTAQYGIPASAV